MHVYNKIFAATKDWSIGKNVLAVVSNRMSLINRITKRALRGQQKSTVRPCNPVSLWSPADTHVQGTSAQAGISWLMSWQRFPPHLAHFTVTNDIIQKSRPCYTYMQGRRLRGDRGIVFPKICRWRGRMCFYPPPHCLENVIANCHSARDWETEKEKIRHQWPTHKAYWFICKHILCYV